MSDDYRPRFVFEISEEQSMRANKVLATYGLRKAIFGKILDNVLDILEKDSSIAIGLLMSEDIVIKGLNQAVGEKLQSLQGGENGRS